MPVTRKIALVLYALTALASLILGLIYLTSSTFMPYHQVALGVPWEELPNELQVLLLALMDVAGAGWLALFVVTAGLLIGPFRRGDRVARVVIPLGFLVCYVPTLWATLTVLTHTPATPPWYGNAIACVATITGLLLDRPWRRDAPEER